MARPRGSDSSFVAGPLLTQDEIRQMSERPRCHAELLVDVRAQGSPRDAHDLIIAATSRATDRTIITADLTAFRALPGVTVRDYR